MKKRRKKKMAPNVKAYLRALKHARSLGYKDPKGEWHDILKRYHKIK